jgi:hypothetical protein
LPFSMAATVVVSAAAAEVATGVSLFVPAFCGLVLGLATFSFLSAAEELSWATAKLDQPVTNKQQTPARQSIRSAAERQILLLLDLGCLGLNSFRGFFGRFIRTFFWFGQRWTVTLLCARDGSIGRGCFLLFRQKGFAAVARKYH